jgi:hypothetical protein
MVVIALFAIVVVGIVVWASSHRPQEGASGVARSGDPSAVRADDARGSDPALRRWAQAGLITEDQAAAIEAYEQERASPTRERPRRTTLPPVAEALGYLGAVLAIIGLLLVLQQTWDQLGLAGHLLLTGGGSGVLYLVGRSVGASLDPALARMRAFAWLCSSAAAGAFAVVGAHDLGGVDGVEGLWLAGSLGVGLHSGALWRGLDRLVQQVPALLATVAATISAGVVVAQAMDLAETSIGWMVSPITATAGVVMVVVGLRRTLPNSLITMAIGTVALVAAAVLVMSTGTGASLLIAVGIGLGLLAVVASPLPPGRPDRLVLGLGGAMVWLFAAPPTIGYYGRDAGLATGTVIVVGGAVLVGLGLTARTATPHLLQGVGAAAILLGAAVTAMAVPDVAPALGLILSITLLALGTRPGAVVLSVVGALGLLGNVPWAIAQWFPGEDIAAVLVLASGITILAVAVVLARMGGRVRAELGRRGGRSPSPT